MLRLVLPLLAVAALSACANAPPATDASMPSGISHVGSAGMTGGPAAAPSGVGAVTTRP